MANVVVAVAETTAGAMADNVLIVMLLFKSIVATVVVAFMLAMWSCGGDGGVVRVVLSLR